MRGRGTRTAVVALLLVGSVLMGTLVAGLGGCRPAPVTSGPVPNGQQIAMALIPIEDTLPFWVADQKGYFREEGVKVTLKTFASATERDAALTAGEVDGAVADLVATALLCAGGTRVTITSLTLGAEGREGRIAVLSPPGSPLKKVEDLRGAEIAVSPNSLIEYTVSRLLEKHGVAPTEVKMVSVPKIPVRFELLMAGKLAAAGLPDPFAALAQKKGAQLIVDDVEDNVSQAVVLFRNQVLQERADAVGRVMRAYARAVTDINKDPLAFRDLLTQKAGVPAEALDMYAHLHFPGVVLPTRAQVEDALDWLGGKGLLKQPLRYQDLVDPRFSSPG